MLTNTHNTVLYVGSTSNLRERMAQHKDGAGSKFATDYNCWKLIWCELFPDFDSAHRFERKLKRWRREWKEALICKTNAEWLEIIPD